jgi:hypothetical protein
MHNNGVLRFDDLKDTLGYTDGREDTSNFWLAHLGIGLFHLLKTIVNLILKIMSYKRK